MKDIITLDYDLKFNTKIHSIQSISLDNEYDINDNILNGTFLVSGEYKATGLSVNLTEFEYKIPFTYDFKCNVDIDTVKLEVEDFTYEINGDLLPVSIEYNLEYNTLLEDEEEINNILNNDDVEIIDFRSDEVKETILEEPKKIEEENDDEYITYHMYIVDEVDTEESIVNKFKVSKEVLRSYNTYDNITTGMKLIIPYND